MHAATVTTPTPDQYKNAVEEEVNPTAADVKAVARAQEPNWKGKKKVRETPRKRVEKNVRTSGPHHLWTPM